MLNDSLEEMKKDFNEDSSIPLYVVTNTDFKFVGVYSCLQRAERIVQMLNGKHDGKNLLISYEYIDDPLTR